MLRKGSAHGHPLRVPEGRLGQPSLLGHNSLQGALAIWGDWTKAPLADRWLWLG